jgi:hypothetical protein
MNSFNFDRVETYTYPHSKLEFGVTHHFIPYNKEHEAEMVEWETEKDVQFARMGLIDLGNGGKQTPRLKTDNYDRDD